MARAKLLTEMCSTGLDVREVEKPADFASGFTVHVQILPSHSLRIVFAPSDPAFPRVHARGPDCPAHRNSDGSLCLWYPKDAPSRRWTPGDGGRLLIAIIVRHLRWESAYRATNIWPGFEAPHGHGSPGLDEQDQIIG
ncbi:hypothetical protein ACYCCF_15720 [Streptomyces argenteolus]|uniref:hypothetical protein n=1 Tax=Streptomyces sp. NPDC025273 TaxID=3155251 RepID=UPI00340B354E